MKDRKLHIQLDLNDETEKKVADIIDVVRGQTTIKRFIVEAVIYYYDSLQGKEGSWKKLANDVSRHEKEIRRICRSIGLETS